MELSRTRETYNQDVAHKGRYLYMDMRVCSATLYHERQTREIVRAFRTQCPPRLSVVDIGCGDGIFTLELFRTLKPTHILGVDIADEAIRVARKRTAGKKSIRFATGSANSLGPVIGSRRFTTAMMCGSLHHMDRPEDAVMECAKFCDTVVVLEPNGYNPLLKLIEKVSPYHRRHGERSYRTTRMDGWFRAAGYRVSYRVFYGLVPIFCPKFLALILRKLEPYLEPIPYINHMLCGCTVTVYKKSAI